MASLLISILATVLRVSLSVSSEQSDRINSFIGITVDWILWLDHKRDAVQDRAVFDMVSVARRCRGKPPSAECEDNYSRASATAAVHNSRRALFAHWRGLVVPARLPRSSSSGMFSNRAGSELHQSYRYLTPRRT